VFIGWTIKSVMDGKSPIPGIPMFGLSGGLGAFVNSRSVIPTMGAIHPY